ncbi:hypothetical protein M8312_10285 [Sphingomonas sp. KRR8]|uniref:hypothetical protein n=1 Tax=Sphingomonas sp. KRR8 TaxID=2942996 RepID=UPI00201FE141|nr:hypothetical protein [Sphingomonas sp. KRR8]URD60174.1 hypothetical protein M8312_10285 [Sphingomonas sp. KRR8]
MAGRAASGRTGDGMMTRIVAGNAPGERTADATLGFAARGCDHRGQRRHGDQHRTNGHGASPASDELDDADVPRAAS